MKNRLLFLLLATGITFKANAQGDTTLRYLHSLSQSVNHWVALPHAAGTNVCAFGFVYIDPATGFMFNLEGFLKNDGSNKLVRIPGKVAEKTREQYNLKPGENPTVAIINEDHYYELDIYPRPDWLASYNEYTDTVAHVVDWARAYNGIKDSQMALDILKDTYQTNPHAAGLEVELGTAYNQLKRYADAIRVMEIALKANPNEPSFYPVIGFALLSSGDVDRALATCDKGVKLCDASHATEKSELAMYMAIAFRSQNNKQMYTQWIEYAKVWAPKHSEIAAALEDM